MEIPLLFQDDDLIVVNKPIGLLTESARPGDDSLLRRVEDMIGRTPVAHHRLDRETSGCILFGKTNRYNRQLARLFSEKKVRKEYWVIVEGDWPQGYGRVETFIGSAGDGRWENRVDSGKPAATTFRCLARADGRSLLQALPKTGRTHQIRLHCLHAGCPVVGDTLYGLPGTEGPLMLHARKLTFRHPGDGRNVEVEAPFPDTWREWVEA
jgi:RluA family pseudouridine synthase